MISPSQDISFVATITPVEKPESQSSTCAAPVENWMPSGSASSGNTSLHKAKSLPPDFQNIQVLKRKVQGFSLSADSQSKLEVKPHLKEAVKTFLEQVDEALSDYLAKNIPAVFPIFPDINFLYELNDLASLYGEFLNVSSCRSHTVLDEEFLDSLSQELRGFVCLEVCAGGGLLSHELRARGVTISATDSFEYLDTGYQFKEFTWDVKRQDAVSAVQSFMEKHPSSEPAALIIFYPSTARNDAPEMFKLFLTNPSNRVFALWGDRKLDCLPESLYQVTDRTESLRYKKMYPEKVLLEYRSCKSV